MKDRFYKISFPILLTVTLFSLWGGFALLIVNPLFYEDVPGYVIGRICIWEYVAFLVAAIIASIMINKWGNIQINESQGRKFLVMNSKYGIYFTVYFILATVVGIWQFWLFSQNF